MIYSAFLSRVYLIGLVLALNISAYSQSPWIKKINHGRYDDVSGLIHGDSHSFYITHRQHEGGSNPVTQNLTKFSTEGEIIWNLKFDNEPYNVYEGRSSSLDDGDVIVSFLFEDSLGLEYKVFRIAPDGIIEWVFDLPRIVKLEIYYAFEIYKIIPFSTNDIRIYFWMNYYSELDPPSAKNGYISVDSLGNEKFREFFDTGNEYQSPYNIIQSKDTLFLKVTRPTMGSFQLLMRYELLDKEYNNLWSYQIGPQDDGSGGPACFDTSGNIYFTWNYDTTGNGGPFDQLPTIISLDNQGEFRWMRHFGEDRGVPVLYDIISTKDGRIIACGQEGNSQLSGGKYRTGWIVCIDTSGNKLWERRYVIDETTDAGNNFVKLIESSDQEIILSGVLYPEGATDVYVLKSDSLGCLSENCSLYNFISLITSLNETTANKNLFYTYFDNSIITIKASTSQLIGRFNYELLNLNGQLIQVGKIDHDKVEINTSNLATGIYLLRIYSEDGAQFSIHKFFKL